MLKTLFRNVRRQLKCKIKAIVKTGSMFSNINYYRSASCIPKSWMKLLLLVLSRSHVMSIWIGCLSTNSKRSGQLNKSELHRFVLDINSITPESYFVKSPGSTKSQLLREALSTNPKLKSHLVKNLSAHHHPLLVRARWPQTFPCTTFAPNCLALNCFTRARM